MDKPRFRLSHFDANEGRLVLAADGMDFDNAEAMLDRFCQLIDANAQDKQTDADLHTWLVDFEGVTFMLKAEHYSASVWLERLGKEGDEELLFLHRWLSRQLAFS
ncbi:hypothetical protein A1OO_00250 [Enterovibrio norvegicus FF-33]|uniref:Aminopeptidase n=1 Tax=Enterovibrio norvegicus FF-454 TaxID=1185651 RepID=A0A1E5CDC8_9GAMM|nr:DUF3630 family protein [Enterovibrio norvegicus]OEE63524.1 hypothetical protein A1OK_06625 [Enterovibrio norvegicus FF-454]OEE71179.1 hypothetical protein A1OO_00250 [Enterovibrio norvegicus FF-33]OEE82499.1 hypothetical protein A1OQ_19770 [Enterovibrio norvegicus FF-162]